jgi:hypothetical protein
MVSPDQYFTSDAMALQLDTGHSIFGGFTPVKWESRTWNCQTGSETNIYKEDYHLQSFLFTLKKPHSSPAAKFPLRAEMKKYAIACSVGTALSFGGDGDRGSKDLCVRENPFKEITVRNPSFGSSYANPTGLDGRTLFTGSAVSAVQLR